MQDDSKLHIREMPEAIRRQKKYICFTIIIFLLFFLLFTVKIKNQRLMEYLDVKFESISVSPEPTVEPLDPKDIVVVQHMVLADNMDYSHYTRILLGVNNILQNPELPTGCEITSLAIVINYLNPEIECDKLDLADNFLEKGTVGQTNPDNAFIGNPRDRRYSFGANAPVLVNAAQKYYATINVSRKIENITGTEAEDLMPYIVSGHPIMVWATMDMAESRISTQWMVGDELVQWHSNFHCLVLMGFDMEKQVYYFADPLKEGITEYGMDIFKDRYDTIGKQAIVIY